jgi:transposase InsO family protein
VLEKEDPSRLDVHDLRVLVAVGVRHRFGAVGNTGSIAIIERFWRQLKRIR